MKNEDVLKALTTKFGEGITEATEPWGLLTVNATHDNIIDVLTFLRDDEQLQFIFLTDLCGVHYPDRALKFEVVYHLHSLAHNVRIRIKVPLSSEHPNVHTASKVFECANWMERETYDFYGIHFDGHPNLKRILNVDELAFFPMRKEIPLEDNTRTDKNDAMFGR